MVPENAFSQFERVALDNLLLHAAHPLPPSPSSQLEGEERLVSGDLSISNPLNEALLSGKVQVFGFALLEELPELR